MEKYSDGLAAAINYMRKMESNYRVYDDWLGAFKNEEQDLLHELELHTRGIAHSLEIAEKIRELRQERRRLKNDVEAIRPLHSFLQNNPHLLDTLGAILGQIRKIEQIQAARQYAPRVRNDLSIIRVVD